MPFFAGIVFGFAVGIGRAVVGAFTLEAFVTFGAGVIVEFAFGTAGLLNSVRTANFGVLGGIAFGAFAVIADIVTSTRGLDIRPSGIASLGGFFARAGRLRFGRITGHAGTTQADGIFAFTCGPDDFRILAFGEFARRSAALDKAFFCAGIAFLIVFLAYAGIAVFIGTARFFFDFAVFADRMRRAVLAFRSKGSFRTCRIGASSINTRLGSAWNFCHDAIRANQKFFGIKALIPKSIHIAVIAHMDIIVAFARAAMFSFAAGIFCNIAMFAYQLYIGFAGRRI